ncbi:MAG: transporter [Oscillospiraceae bacterium]|nr:transporter [Oscillospiraceae bacterium]
MIFFTQYGYKSFIGLLVVMLLYIFVGKNIVDLSLKYNLKSYNDLIKLVSPNIFGSIITLLLSTLFLSSSSIILAGSGSLLNEFFNVPKWIGLVIMLSITIFITLRKTKGLIEVNSIIVPLLTIIILTIFVLHLIHPSDKISLQYILSIDTKPNFWLFQSINYGSFNIFACCGVLIPLIYEIKDKKVLNGGIIIGAVLLTLLSLILNFVLIINVPEIFQKEIPLLYVTGIFSRFVQAMLLIVMWLEMFSTVVSDVFTLSGTIGKLLKIPYEYAIFIMLAVAVVISQFGFANLVNYLYPAFAVISTIFVIQILYFKFFKTHILRKLEQLTGK